MSEATTSTVTPSPLRRVDDASQLLAQATRATLEDQAFVCVSGPDAHKFLQGQLTCHLDEVTSTHSVCGSYCTVQGRMISSFRIAQRADGALLLRMHASVVDATVQTLKKYGVFSKVQIATEPDWVAIAVDGSDSRSMLTNAPTQPNDAVADAQGITIQTDSKGQRFEVWAPRASAELLCQQLSGVEQTSVASWYLRNIRDGIGHVESASSDMFIPQMLNFQITGFVHFKKGCYTGQEIVARMQYLGKLKRHMHRYEITGGPAPSAGDDIAIDGNTQSVGNIVVAVATQNDRYEALVVTTDETMDNPSLHLRDRAGSTFRRLELPYAITVGSPKS